MCDCKEKKTMNNSKNVRFIRPFTKQIKPPIPTGGIYEPLAPYEPTVAVQVLDEVVITNNQNSNITAPLTWKQKASNFITNAKDEILNLIKNPVFIIAAVIGIGYLIYTQVTKNKY